MQGIPHHGHQCIIHHSHENAQFEILTHWNFPADPMQFDLTRFSCFMLGYFMQLLVSQHDVTVRKAVNVHSCQKVSFQKPCIISCRRAAVTICPRPGLQVLAWYTSCMHMDRSLLLYVHVGLPVQPTKAAWWPFDLESGVQVTCDVGYLYANFSLPRPLCSRLRPDVSDRQMLDRQMSDAQHASALWGGGITSLNTTGHPVLRS